MIDNHQLVRGGKHSFKYPDYILTNRAQELLISGGIISQQETSQDLLKRVISTLFSLDDSFGTHTANTKKAADNFISYVVEGSVMLGTPILTNAGRYETPLSSCAVVPVDLQELNSKTKERICAYHKQNMGTGFNLTRYENPVAILNWINELSAQETATGQYDRYIGNMGLLHISHPFIREFISAKRFRDMNHFNISVDVTEDFMNKAELEEPFTLSNGNSVLARDLLMSIAENAWHNGDPGLIFLERMNNDNPVSAMSKYVSTPPCAEMGLIEGETCHFGYINLSKVLRKKGHITEIDYDKLAKITQLLIRVLDNAIEYSIPRYPTAMSRDIAQQNRRVGIGICGLADMLLACQLPYDSQEARDLARDVLSFINYTSKSASVTLAEQRGSCSAMDFPQTNRYLSGSYLEDKYGRNPTRTVSSQEWAQLAVHIRSTGKLRNISTTALPPTGRASILLEATPSIEPIFSIFASDGSIQPIVIDLLSNALEGQEFLLEQVCQEASNSGSFQGIEVLPVSTRECLKTAKEISSLAHIQMIAHLAGVQGVIDESASKTVNLPYQASVDDIKELFLLSYRLGLKNISVYRDKTKVDQPINL